MLQAQITTLWLRDHYFSGCLEGISVVAISFVTRSISVPFIRELNNKFIPYIRLGFADLDAFLATIPDVVRAIPAKDGKRIFYKVVSAPKMKHITRFVKRQIASKHKR